jgi:glycosyltransferase involved in cell wall biosynthesis
MKILWITNIILPEACKEMNMPNPVGGGWLESSANSIVSQTDLNLAIATVYSGNILKVFKLNKITYYLIPTEKSTTALNVSLENYWSDILKQYNPDIIHIHGTEYAHGLSCINSNPDFKYVISIQGIISMCAQYYLTSLNTWDIIKNITIRDIIRLDTLFNAKYDFKRRGKIEIEYFKKAKFVIGRTTWDYIHSKIINPKVIYFKCNETLRSGFYKSRKWELESCNKYSIFLSQASYPLKGLHQVLKAISILKADFPNIKLRIAGQNIFKFNSFVQRLKITGYAKYINSLIIKLNLECNVEFIGQLNEEQMIEEYLNANLFICPSSIENSPNSLGEAQILGLPCIASYVGGTPDMINHNEDGFLYRYEEFEMLSFYIKEIFQDELLSNRFSKKSIISSEQRHISYNNFKQTIAIYNSIFHL